MDDKRHTTVYYHQNQHFRHVLTISGTALMLVFLCVTGVLAESAEAKGLSSPRPPAASTSPCIVIHGLRDAHTDLVAAYSRAGITPTADTVPANYSLSLIDLQPLVMPEAGGIRILATPDYILQGDLPHNSGSDGNDDNNNHQASDRSVNLALAWPCDDPLPTNSISFLLMPCWYDPIDWTETTTEQALTLKSDVTPGRLATLYIRYHDDPPTSAAPPPQPQSAAEGTDPLSKSPAPYMGPTTRVRCFLPESDAMTRAVKVDVSQSYRVDVNHLYWDQDVYDRDTGESNDGTPAASYLYEVTEEPGDGPEVVMRAPEGKEPAIIHGKEYCRIWLRVYWSPPETRKQRDRDPGQVRWTMRQSMHPKYRLSEREKTLQQVSDIY